MSKEKVISRLRRRFEENQLDSSVFDFDKEWDDNLMDYENERILGEKIDKLIGQQLKQIYRDTQSEKYKLQQNEFLEKELKKNEQEKEEILSDLFKFNRTIGVVGDINTGKSALVLSQLISLKAKFQTEVYVLGVETSLEDYLKSKGINVLLSKEDILDLKLTNSVIFIDEFGDLFSPQTKDKQLIKIKKFFNRLAHSNNYVILSTAVSGFWNKFMCSLVRCFLVKTIEFDNLVNGTILKRKILDLAYHSEYRFEMPNNTYYVLNNKELAKRYTFPYNPELDSKKDLPSIFQKK